MRVSGCTNQKHQGAACRPWAQKGSEQAASSHDGAKEFGLEIFSREIGDRHRSPTQQAVHIFLAEIADGAPGLQHAPEITAAGVVNVGPRHWRSARPSGVKAVTLTSGVIN